MAPGPTQRSCSGTGAEQATSGHMGAPTVGRGCPGVVPQPRAVQEHGNRVLDRRQAGGRVRSSAGGLRSGGGHWDAGGSSPTRRATGKEESGDRSQRG